MQNPIAWTVQKVHIITFGSLDKILDEISGTAHEWSCEIVEDYCHITYSNPDEYGYARPCTYAFPVIGELGKDELEKLIIIDGMVAETIQNTDYENFDDDSGEPYTYTNDEMDWSACMDMVLAGIDKAARHVINANPNVNGEA
jgi:hypothetical protein